MPRCVWNGNNFPGRWSFSFTENSSILCVGSVVYDTSGSPMATAALQARPSHAHRYPLRCTVARLCFFGDPCCMQSNSYFFVPLSLRVKFFFFFHAALSINSLHVCLQFGMGKNGMPSANKMRKSPD